MKDFLGLTAVVTGGSSGIGHAVVRQLTQRGAHVAILDLNPPRETTEGSFHVWADIGSSDSVRDAVAQSTTELGGLDIVLNNAGIGASGSVTANADDEWTRVLNVNVTGISRVVRSAFPHLLNSPSAAIVNTSSVVANVGVPNRALYSASKGAVQSLTYAMAADHVADGIRVNCVTPGTAETPWVNRLLEASDDPVHERAMLEGRQPMGRLVTADEVAYAVAYLASPLSGSTTGTSLGVDGGMQNLRLPGPPPKH
jgi:NAD(P)-dependent dehydrogenase (short-subunit alcohol dehydrogenase family)